MRRHQPVVGMTQVESDVPLLPPFVPEIVLHIGFQTELSHTGRVLNKLELPIQFRSPNRDFHRFPTKPSPTNHFILTITKLGFMGKRPYKRPFSSLLRGSLGRQYRQSFQVRVRPSPEE
jgi:hypothetical protein